MSQFILFEGLDRTGKSSIAKRIAHEMNAVLLHSPPELLMPFRSHFDALDNETNFSYYLTANHVLNCQIEELLKTSSVVCDRYFHTTIAYHSVKLKRNLDSYLNGMTVTPHRIYYLKGDVEVLEQRAKNSGKDRFHGPDLWREVMRNYDRLFENLPNVLVIDTTDKTEEEVYKIVSEDIEKRTKN
ncbi:MAG: hypothetical protein R6V53_00745 [Candidatus Woesearchaeota archaeon]